MRKLIMALWLQISYTGASPASWASVWPKLNRWLWISERIQQSSPPQPSIIRQLRWLTITGILALQLTTSSHLSPRVMLCVKKHINESTFIVSHFSPKPCPPLCLHSLLTFLSFPVTTFCISPQQQFTPNDLIQSIRLEMCRSTLIQSSTVKE